MARRAEAPTRDRGSYHHGDLRNALVHAALDLVAREGVESFSLREAARAVGVSPAAAYRHFEDKAALLTACAVDGLSRLSAAMQQAIARAPGAPGTPARAAAELALLGAAYVDFAVEHPSHFRVMFGPWCEGLEKEDLPPELLPNGLDPYDLLVRTLDGLVAAGAIAPAAREGAEIAAWSAVHGLASLVVEGALTLTAAERAGALGIVQRTLLRGLGAAPGLLGRATPPAGARPGSSLPGRGCRGDGAGAAGAPQAGPRRRHR